MVGLGAARQHSRAALSLSTRRVESAQAGGGLCRIGEAQRQLKIVLVLLALLVNVKPTMNRIFTLIVLLGIVMGAVLTGCNQSSDTTPKAPDTNAAPAAPSMPSTNK